MTALTIRLPSLKAERDSICREENKAVSDVVRESLRCYIAVERFRSVRRKLKIPEPVIRGFLAINIEVMYANENIWLSQKRMAELIDCTPDNISLHLKNIYAEKEFDEKSSTENFPAVQTEGNNYNTIKYNME